MSYNTKEKIEKGIEIRDKLFYGNPYRQMGLIMDGLKAHNIKINPDSTPEEITWADQKIDELDDLYNQIRVLASETR